MKIRCIVKISPTREEFGTIVDVIDCRDNMRQFSFTTPATPLDITIKALKIGHPCTSRYHLDRKMSSDLEQMYSQDERLILDEILPRIEKFLAEYEE